MGLNLGGGIWADRGGFAFAVAVEFGFRFRVQDRQAGFFSELAWLPVLYSAEAKDQDFAQLASARVLFGYQRGTWGFGVQMRFYNRDREVWRYPGPNDTTRITSLAFGLMVTANL